MINDNKNCGLALGDFKLVDPNSDYDLLKFNTGLDTVVSVEECGEQDVYDFVVPGPHNYIAASVMSHNTAVSMNIALHMARYELARVAYVTLEMSQDQCIARISSILTQVPLADISRHDKKEPVITKEQQELMAESYKKLVAQLKKDEACLTFYEPQGDPTIQELLFTLKPHNYDIIFIDQLTLLAGTDGDDQAKALGRVGRYCKRWAASNHKIVVGLAQLSDEGKVKYSRALREHANHMFSWTADEEFEDISILDIYQDKGRNVLRFPFSVQSINATGTIKDISDDYVPTDRTKKGKKGKTPVKAKDKEDDDYLGDVAE